MCDAPPMQEGHPLRTMDTPLTAPCGLPALPACISAGDTSRWKAQYYTDTLLTGKTGLKGQSKAQLKFRMYPLTSQVNATWAQAMNSRPTQSAADSIS